MTTPTQDLAIRCVVSASHKVENRFAKLWLVQDHRGVWSKQALELIDQARAKHGAKATDELLLEEVPVMLCHYALETLKASAEKREALKAAKKAVRSANG